jgi:Zn-dependent protease
MRGYITLKRPTILGMGLHLHWSALLGAAVLFGAFMRQPIQGVLAVASYFSLILLHELGHALMAKRLGYDTTGIFIGAFHGLCECDSPHYLREEAAIAWGGVLMQAAVALPLIAVAQLAPLGANPYFSIVAAILGPFSLLMAAVNLLPIAGLDGQLAWRLVPILWREARDQRAAMQTTRELIRRVK